ncbi:MAG: ABC transporter permease [Peptococcaceae bacterium]|jgi:peptide/nickel transport system permease protein|nr:ABC transporter permease [Peptococcaceae bacterium]
MLGPFRSREKKAASREEKAAIPAARPLGRRVGSRLPHLPRLPRLARRPATVVSLLLLFSLIFCGIFAPWLAPYDPFLMGKTVLAPPDAGHWLGTDQLGRDNLSRLLYGARISLATGFLTVGISAFLGVTVGLVSGYYGKAVDLVLMRVTDIFLSFPLLMLILVVVSVLGASLRNIILVLGCLGWPALARLVRGETLAVKQRDYIQICRVLGFSGPRIMLAHILPNIARPILVAATFAVAKNILLESALSFLGVGVPLPAPSWGNMLAGIQSISLLTKYYWLWLAPGLAILLCALAVNFLGEALMEALEV